MTDQQNLPPFLMTSEKGSFARKTIEERKPTIIHRILSHFDYTKTIRGHLHDLISELNSGQLQPLHEATSDRSLWNQDIEPWLEHNWLDIPWFLAEAYFYRRILEAVWYFRPGPWMGLDPYHHLKHREITNGIVVFTREYQNLPNKFSEEAFHIYCAKALWGNRGDLSNLTSFEESMAEQSDRMVLNHISKAYSYFSQGVKKAAIFLDNIGKELFFDIALIDFLLSQNLVGTFTLYLKNQPFFVSDAMPKDLQASLDVLAASDSLKNRELASRFRLTLMKQRIQIETPPFFTIGRMYRQIPTALARQIGEHDIVILKGDVNYRRLFGDRHWPLTTPIARAADYFPTTFLSLRTLKSEVALGLPEDIAQDLEQNAEPDWLINGRRGMITFWEKGDHENNK